MRKIDFNSDLMMFNLVVLFIGMAIEILSFGRIWCEVLFLSNISCNCRMDLANLLSQ